MKLLKTILIWVIGLMFIATGIMKFLNKDEMSAEIFARADYPNWMFFGAATLELAGGLLLLIRKTRIFGLAAITIVMIGAICTHLYLGDNVGHIIAPAVIIAISAWIKSDTEVVRLK